LNKRFKAEPEAAAMARQALGELKWHVHPDVVQRVRLLVSEIVTNSVRHAKTQLISMDVDVSESKVRIAIGDRGDGFVARPHDPQPEQVSGWGLFLVEQLSDAWGVETPGGGTLVWFDVKL
jgi:anti-sigma regulatory factor (Ser/Thr protein kinase)